MQEENASSIGGRSEDKPKEKIAAIQGKRDRHKAMLVDLERTGEDQVSLTGSPAASACIHPVLRRSSPSRPSKNSQAEAAIRSCWNRVAAAPSHRAAPTPKAPASPRSMLQPSMISVSWWLSDSEVATNRNCNARPCAWPWLNPNRTTPANTACRQRARPGISARGPAAGRRRPRPVRDGHAQTGIAGRCANRHRDQKLGRHPPNRGPAQHDADHPDGHQAQEVIGAGQWVQKPLP